MLAITDQVLLNSYNSIKIVFGVFEVDAGISQLQMKLLQRILNLLELQGLLYKNSDLIVNLFRQDGTQFFH